ncbi:phosphogluconate dehydratase [Ponticoccus sp. SC2-23]|uniref:phosphogluconate dehydratase n=1 Tax=Alexandriicola marinus TaxID=2081710 RepID=UPI000FDC8783|nr:phosphogluconate dehydratase [Alexandriicola marinus]MBM1219144.1 phosphogluconate dehydratase [Ponticoccus sp. SC6-9]MBM1223784.1 phosphogluconate dehydratase [Ponticoccus sp. SC6-15]MBM1228958.1 phosphogluconate dehydratase [Ponticoccus sp. SC6-38]MBM1232750.1 phosphogluconate dehydratase [Ponticoccus sp. SC6-45]MBM1237300.1 phosphogluconate dehydratase [Ponticoccus sp. SC6-49]MBM1241761.1 phosphogluconate dehydratase [Ponticoccus sp. SC2-64]MBM1246274.1 phosphogluconate dehydratase [Po
MPLDRVIAEVTDRIIERSAQSRGRYLETMRAAAADGPRRAHLTCGNQAHAYAAMGADKDALIEARAPNIGIITAYNDMLSAHQPFETYPDLIRSAARAAGATAQVAGGVPAMCDGVTQGQTGMELSLFSRDVIALAAGVGLSHNTFDAAIYLGVCDKIVPGLVMAAATFGYIPSIFLPAGPMTSGLPNDEKAKVRQQFANGEVGRDALMAAEMASYHGPGTCTFYGTANSNQMLMEFMGLHLPGASFVNPGTPLREALTVAGTERAASITALGNDFRPVYEILDEKAFVNGIVGLMATGGSTNLVMHLPAMAKAAGIQLDLQDFSDISSVTPLMAKVYPNGLADVNHFHAAGGLGYMIGQLLDAGLLHEDVTTVAGDGLSLYTQEPKLEDGKVVYAAGAGETLNDKILRPASDPFQSTGGLVQLAGNLGRAVIKTSAVAPERHVIEAPARIFHDQGDVKTAFQNGEITSDTIVVVRFQGPKSNGMPELHSLTPTLAVLQDRGLKVALVTDGRMSGASGKVPAAIHVCPEAADGGPIALLRDGDMLRLDATTGTLTCLEDLSGRTPAVADLSGNGNGVGRELFEVFRRNVGLAAEGAGVVV